MGQFLRQKKLCLHQRFGHVLYHPIIHSPGCRSEHCAKNIECSFEWKEGQSPTLTKHDTIINCKSENCFPTVVLGVIVDTSPRSGADTAADSFGRQREVQTGLNHSRKDCLKENLDHSAVLVKQYPKHCFHIFQRTRQLTVSFSEGPPNVIFGNAQSSRELHAEGILKVEKTGYHKQQLLGIQLQRITKFSNESRLHHRYALVVQDLATQWIQSYPARCYNFPSLAICSFFRHELLFTFVSKAYVSFSCLLVDDMAEIAREVTVEA